ncbi:MAG: hypothetical protein F6J86_44345 [Symploca sp. SIO1B1]|nr:hypothetical protein [Symploca sp. SIO1C2]NES00735.1 hypothetical protein [Symploca sp. SIO1B1]
MEAKCNPTQCTLTLSYAIALANLRFYGFSLEVKNELVGHIVLGFVPQPNLQFYGSLRF